jgi:hypothetical protein
LLDPENPIIRKIFEVTGCRNVPASLREFNIRDTEQIFIFIDGIQAMPSIAEVLKYHSRHGPLRARRRRAVTSCRVSARR